MKKILVTGGLGYIGSHTVISLVDNGYEPIIIDDLSNCNSMSLNRLKTIVGDKPMKVYFEDVRDRRQMRRIFEEEKSIYGAIHFAAHKYVGESMKKPLKYYTNNLDSVSSLVTTMLEYGSENILFSSSCSVYGNCETQPVTEDQKTDPRSVYAKTKEIGEEMIKSYCEAYGFKSISLRYFNPAGAHSSGMIGEDPRGLESNLFPRMCESALFRNGGMTIFGKDYDTKDGTPVRDYIHIEDLASAHVAAFSHLDSKEEGFYDVYNVGTGLGTTVLECIETFQKVNGVEIDYTLGERRDGDAEKVWASNEKIAKEIGWEARKNLEDICRSSFQWYVNLKSFKD